MSEPPINVLVIEDNLAEARLLEEVLKGTLSDRFSLIHVKRLGEAIGLLQTKRLDVALLDLTLPDSMGLDSLDTLIKHAPNLPIVVLTNTNDEELAVDAVRHGAQDYLFKRQVNLDILVRAVRYAIERKQTSIALQIANEELEHRVKERTAELETANELLKQEIDRRQSIQERLVLAQKAGKIGTFEWDLQTDKFTWSIELEALYGLEPGSFEDNLDRWLDTLHPEDRPKVSQQLQEIITQGLGLDTEFRILSPQGNSRWIAVKSSVFHNDGGKALRTIGIHMDVTEKKELEAQFLRAQRLESLGTLSGGIAHDLNNILTPILAVAQLLPLRIPNLDDRTQGMIKILESSAKRGAALISQILSFARGIEGKRVCLQLSHLISDIEKILHQTLPKSIEISTDLPRDLWMVLGDQTQIHQVLMNLCVNGRDAMPNGGILSISAVNIRIDDLFTRTHLEATPGNYVKILVSDTGSGIPTHHLDRIFDPFFTTKEVGKGTGLGLSAVLGIVKSHSGFVEVESQINQGTKFHIYLPACYSLSEISSPDSELPEGQQQLVLIVDDEMAICELTKTTLENHNYRVLTAHNGQEAIELYAKYQDEIAIVLMDMMMPVMDGATTITSLKLINPHGRVIAMSGLNTSEAIAQAERLGFDRFLTKPFTTSDLLATLAQN
jgi:two-component system, cell cycle sensor histidine kinase and response regulator CckA